MSQEIINVGVAPFDPSAEGLRSGGVKINNNFTELYGVTGGHTAAIASNAGAIAGLAENITTLADDIAAQDGEIIEIQGDIAEINDTLDDLAVAQNNTTKWMSNVWPLEGVPNPLTVANYLNAYEQFTVTQTESRVFYRFLVQLLFPDASAKSYYYLFDFGGGKGKWGFNPGGAPDVFPVQASKVRLLGAYPVVPNDIEEDPGATIVALGEIEVDGFLAAANAEEHDFTDTETQFYFSYYIGDVLYLALFIGTPGVYGGGGMGADDFTEGDFAQVTNSDVTAVPNLESVTQAGATTPYPMTVTSDGTSVQYQGDGLLYTGANGKTVKVKINQVAADTTFNNPENKTGAHTYVVDSDLDEYTEDRVLKVEYPAGFSLRPFHIYERGGRYYTSMVIRDLVNDKIKRLRPYYVDFVNGSNSNNGSEALPYKTVIYALQQGAKLIYLEKGIHQSSTWPAGLNNNTYGSDDKFIVAKDPSSTYIVNNTEGLTWGAASGIYSASIAGSTPGGLTGGVVDFKYTNKYGLPQSLKSVASLALAISTASSYFLDTANNLLYVHTLDNRSPDSNVIALTNYQGKTFSLAASEYVFIEGVTFMGGANALAIGTVSSAATLGNALINKCRFLYARDNGFRVTITGGIVWSSECVAYDNGRDGFNYTQHASLTSQRIIETYNIGWDSGVRREDPLEYAMNGSSVHNNVTVLRIGCKYWRNYGPNVNDVGGSSSFLVGVECFECLAPNTAPNFVAINGDFSTSIATSPTPSNMWLYGCKSKDPILSFSTPKYANNNPSVLETSMLYVYETSYLAQYLNNVTIGAYTTGDGAATVFPPLSAYTSYDPAGNKVTGTYVGTPAWAGTTPPSGMSAIYGAEVKKTKVSVWITLSYSTPGVGNTAVSVPLPAGLPAPSANLLANNNNDFVAPAQGYLSTGPGATPPAARAFLRKVSGGYNVYVTAASGAYSMVGIQVDYLID